MRAGVSAPPPPCLWSLPDWGAMGGCVAQVCTVVEKLAREQGIFGDEAIVCKADDCFFLCIGQIIDANSVSPAMNK